MLYTLNYIMLRINYISIKLGGETTTDTAETTQTFLPSPFISSHFNHIGLHVCHVIYRNF